MKFFHQKRGRQLRGTVFFNLSQNFVIHYSFKKELFFFISEVESLNFD